MKRKILSIAAMALLSTGVRVDAHSVASITLHRYKTIPIPGKTLRNFDISAFSSARGVYGFSDRSNHSVDLINAKTNAFLGRATGFSRGGPNGLVAVGMNSFWAGDGHSQIRVVNIHSMRITDTIRTGGKERVDELTYDPRLHLVVAANNDDKPPFLTFVSTKGTHHHIVGKLSLPQATDGVEQPAWNPVDGKIYVSIPVLNHHKNTGGVAIIDPRTRKVVGMIHVHECMPAGLAMGPNDQLLVGCSDDAVSAGFAPKSIILNLKTRAVARTIKQVGGSDEVWYDPGSERYYLAAVANTGGPVLGVIDAAHDRWLTNLKSGPEAHSVAADVSNGQVFVPVAANKTIAACKQGCVEVFGVHGTR